MQIYQGLLESLYFNSGEKYSLAGLTIPSLARLVSQFMNGPMSGERLLILTPTAMEAEDLLGDLQFFWPEGNLSLLPGGESKPFMNQLVGAGLGGERLWSLYQLADVSKSSVVVASISSVMRRLISVKDLMTSARYLARGTEISFTELARFFASSGYNSVGQVEARSDFSVRGGIIDFFPPGQLRPVRLEFFGDFIDSIRTFRVDDQISVTQLDEILVLPNLDVNLNPDNCRKAAQALEKLAQNEGWHDLLWAPIFEKLNDSRFFGDLENWTPLFLEKTFSIGAFLNECGARLMVYEPERLKENGEAVWLGLGNHFARLAQEERPHLPLDSLYQPPEELWDELVALPQGLWGHRELAVSESGSIWTVQWQLPLEVNSDLKAMMSVPRKATGLLGPLAARIKALLGRGINVHLILRTREQSRRLAEMLAEYDLDPGQALKGRVADGQLSLEVGQLSGGFVAPFDHEAFISEDEIFGSRQRFKRRATEEFRGLKSFASLKDLTPGDFIVHNEHGIGQYLGLVTLTPSTGHKGDFLDLVYRGGDKLYVPVERFGAVSKYVGASDHPPYIDRLGSGSWEKLKSKVKENIRQMAEELLKLYAARQIAPGFSFSARDNMFLEFESSFEFDETPDQKEAIDDVLMDLNANKPMDRLVCGDVGYGKTEVALRAAFKVVADNKQVAVLVPTTILAEQHGKSFAARLSDWSIKVASLSRFKKLHEQKDILLQLAEGQLDIVVGTHRLLQKDVVFKDLGLLVIDEEHRFGVSDKEKLKKLRTSVDVLSMSATPIPRSLSMSMAGIRDMSVIETPPQDRLSVKTTLIKCEDEAICEAIDRELARGGQVFFIHNRVKDIQLWVNRLKKLMPLVRFGVGHGQMKAQELEKVMLDFINHDIDVWVATTIVESGLDFSEANTIIIDRADCYGLAQLYQLRGRVGRGHQQAYAYLMVDDPDTLTSDAKKRLKALLNHSELGSGYQIALHDLQIRGSGNILGTAQSGQASLVGYEMYSQLMEQTISELKNEPYQEEYEPEVIVGLPAYLPEVYLPDTESRLIIYRRLAGAKTETEIDVIEIEMRDRFGQLPEETLNLLELMKVKILLKAVKVRRMESGSGGLTLSFGPEGPANYEKLLALVTSNGSKMKLTPSGRLYVAGYSQSDRRPLDGVKAFLKNLA